MPGRFLLSIRSTLNKWGSEGLCVWSNSLKGGEGNTYMPLLDHPYSDVNIIYSVVQTRERATDRGTNSAPNMQKACQALKGSVTGNTDLENYIISNRVAPATDADVHALCTKPTVLRWRKAENPQGVSGRNHRTVRGTTKTCRHQVNERSAWLPQRSMKVNWQPHVFHLHNKKEKKSVRCKSESIYHKI